MLSQNRINENKTKDDSNKPTKEIIKQPTIVMKGVNDVI